MDDIHKTDGSEGRLDTHGPENYIASKNNPGMAFVISLIIRWPVSGYALTVLVNMLKTVSQLKSFTILVYIALLEGLDDVKGFKTRVSAKPKTEHVEMLRDRAPT